MSFSFSLSLYRKNGIDIEVIVLFVLHGGPNLHGTSASSLSRPPSGESGLKEEEEEMKLKFESREKSLDKMVSESKEKEREVEADFEESKKMYLNEETKAKKLEGHTSL